MVLRLMLQQLNVEGSFTCNYLLRMPTEVTASTQLVILLHGYQQTARYLYKKLERHLPPDCIVLAPCAPFPVPARNKGGYRIGFSWYFYDFSKRTYMVDMATAIDYLQRVMKKLGLEAQPKIIVGYSQGGFLAPFLASHLAKVKQVVGIACHIRIEELARQEGKAFPPSYPVDAIHGDQDVIVDSKEAKKLHDEFIRQGGVGEFHLLAGSGHKLSHEMQAKVNQCLMRP